MSQTFQVIEGYLASLSKQSELESWKKDHDDAMACYAIEEIVAFATFVYQRIVALDNHWHSEIFRKRIPYEESKDKAIGNLFRLWYEQATHLLELVAMMKRKGYDVVGSETLASHQKETLALLRADEEGGDCEKLVRFRDEAITAHARGESKEFGSWRE